MIPAYVLILTSLFALAANDYKSQAGQDTYCNEIFLTIKEMAYLLILVHMMVLALGIAGILKKNLTGQDFYECNPAVFEKLKENRSCTCIYGCISEVEGNVKFRQVENNQGFDMLSGIESKLDPKDIERLDDGKAAFTIIDVPSYRLNNILEKHRLFYVDFLSLDVEGAELGILKTIDFERFHIHVMTIENNYRKPDIRLFLESHGLRYVTTVHVDDIYLNIRLPKNIILPKPAF